MKEKFVLVLPDIRSAHNVGAMFRTADGAGVDKIYLTGYTARPPHPQLDKVSLGAEKWLPSEYHRQTWRLLTQLREKGYNIVALEKTATSRNLFGFKPKFPLALVVGNEKTGVTKNLLKYCQSAVHIPMAGKKSSLNVSVAAGVAMYQISLASGSPLFPKGSLWLAGMTNNKNDPLLVSPLVRGRNNHICQNTL